ncbi:UNVERIFIED_CONTAM: Long chain acyl-CoA synthetase 4 [Sesamum calycinum]|uniref:Long chain acyl-CoA synthetase 4 n=1 Tax=Sesamum calycinum TaxID=2727403 RepID=A0AAW2LY91_9LAMI
MWENVLISLDAKEGCRVLECNDFSSNIVDAIQPTESKLMAYRRGVTARAKFFYQQQQRAVPSFSHVRRDDSDREEFNSNPIPGNTEIRNYFQHRFFGTGNSFGAFSGSRNLFKDMRFGIPAGCGPVFSRNFSSGTVGEGAADKIEILNDVVDVLGDKAVEVAGQVAPVVSEVAVVAADSFFPVAALQYLIDYVHTYTGFNWWASIVVTTLLIRSIQLPLLINQLKSTSKFTLLRPKLEAIKEEMQNRPDKYSWMTYKEVYEIVLKVGNSIRSCGIEEGGRCGIYGANSPEWIMSMEACNAHGLHCVPLYDTLGAGAVEFIICHAEVALAFVEEKKVSELLKTFPGATKCLRSDIGEWQENGSLKIIDRKKNIFKLSQGEYVAVENLENIYGLVPAIESIWVYGNSFESFLVAIINPNKQVLEQWAEENGVSGDFNALCENPKVKQYFLGELARIAKEKKLKGFEFIKAVHLDPVPFDMERDLITPTFKEEKTPVA